METRRWTRGKLADPWSIHVAWADGFILINVPVADFYVKTATGVHADPCFVVDRRSLAAIIRQRNQLTNIALQTFRKFPTFHETPSHSSVGPSISPGFGKLKVNVRAQLAILRPRLTRPDPAMDLPCTYQDPAMQYSRIPCNTMEYSRIPWNYLGPRDREATPESPAAYGNG